MKTPYYLIHYDKLEKNIESFQSSLKSNWPNSKIAYSVKTNSLPWLLNLLHSKGLLVETVSDEEYQLSKLCGYEDNEIVFNGPIKGELQFEEACKNNAYINIDSQNDLKYLKIHAVNDAKIGIRVNVPTSLFDKEDISFDEDGFRFGFSEGNGDFAAALNVIQENCPNIKLGLHLHCNSITRSTAVYRVIAQYASYLIKKYELALDYIDIGGGFFGGVEGKPTPDDYLNAIKEELIKTLNPVKTTLIIEPGSAIIGSVIDLHTTVLDVKDTSSSRIVTTDGSRIHIDPLWAKKRYMYSVKTKNKEIKEKQIICGYTCMDHDRIMSLKNEYELSIEDEIIYHRVGAYTMTFGGMFIRYLPEVYVKTSDKKIIKVRSEIKVDEYYKIHSYTEREDRK